MSLKTKSRALTNVLASGGTGHMAEDCFKKLE